MVRVIKNKGKEYLIVNTCLQIQEEINVTDVPMYVQIDLTNYTEEKRVQIYKVAHKLFNHNITANLTKQKEIKKSWWQKLINFKK